MSARLIGLSLVFIAFCAFSAHAVAEVGYLGLFESHRINAGTRQVFVDLVIALTIVLGFMWGDARERGLPFLPYAIGTLLLGSIGPLAYLIHREAVAKPARARAEAAR